MSTIKSSAEDLTLNADGSNEIKFQINAVEKASINSSGLLTSTTIDATALTGNLPAIDGSSVTGIGCGITAASQWRLNTHHTGTADPITSNLEVVDTDGYGSLGSAMTESSGVFTFPSTGYWLIGFTGEFYCATDSRYNCAVIETTTDDSSYNHAAKATGNIAHTYSTPHATATASFLFDVTNTSTHKVRFVVLTDSHTTTVYASTSINQTHMTFIKLGDT